MDDSMQEQMLRHLNITAQAATSPPSVSVYNTQKHPQAQSVAASADSSTTPTGPISTAFPPPVSTAFPPPTAPALSPLAVSTAFPPPIAAAAPPQPVSTAFPPPVSAPRAATAAALRALAWSPVERDDIAVLTRSEVRVYRAAAPPQQHSASAAQPDCMVSGRRGDTPFDPLGIFSASASAAASGDFDSFYPGAGAGAGPPGLALLATVPLPALDASQAHRAVAWGPSYRLTPGGAAAATYAVNNNSCGGGHSGGAGVGRSASASASAGASSVAALTAPATAFDNSSHIALGLSSGRILVANLGAPPLTPAYTHANASSSAAAFAASAAAAGATGYDVSHPAGGAAALNFSFALAPRHARPVQCLALSPHPLAPSPAALQQHQQQLQ